MNYKRLAGSVVCGLAVGALAMAPAQAQNTMMTGTTADTNMGVSAPSPVSGQVLRYYTDRAGYVTAMDVQTNEGVQMLRFAPNLGQRLYTTYPPGGTVDVFVVQSPYGKLTRYDVVGIGKEVPRAGYMQPYMISDVELLKAEPYIVAGSQETTVKGKLSRVITDDAGDVLGLVLEDNTLIRVPREARPASSSYAGSERVTPLFKGAQVIATGYEEAPNYGVISTFPNRLSARAIVVNGHSVGAVGFPRMMKGSSRALLDVDIAAGLGGKSAVSEDEMTAFGQGYRTYSGNMTSAG